MFGRRLVVYDANDFTFNIEQVAACVLYMSYVQHTMNVGDFLRTWRLALVRPLEHPHPVFPNRWFTQDAGTRFETRTEFGPAARDNEISAAEKRWEFLDLLSAEAAREAKDLEQFKSTGMNPCLPSEPFDAWFRKTVDNLQRIDSYLVELNTDVQLVPAADTEEARERFRQRAERAQLELAKQLAEMCRYYAHLTEVDPEEGDLDVEALRFQMRRLAALMATYEAYRVGGTDARAVLNALDPQFRSDFFGVLGNARQFSEETPQQQQPTPSLEESALQRRKEEARRLWVQ